MVSVIVPVDTSIALTLHINNLMHAIGAEEMRRGNGTTRDSVRLLHALAHGMDPLRPTPSLDCLADPAPGDAPDLDRSLCFQAGTAAMLHAGVVDERWQQRDALGESARRRCFLCCKFHYVKRHDVVEEPTKMQHQIQADEAGNSQRESKTAASTRFLLSPFAISLRVCPPRVRRIQ